MSALGSWLLAARPRTLAAGTVPVLVGTALAASCGGFHPVAAAAALAGALLIQVGTNLVNDHYDFVRGADTADRLGPLRATQQGLLPTGAALRGGAACFGAAVLVGVYLVARGGWPIAVVGLVSVVAGYSYTGGPFPLGYRGLGDVFVFVFFGLVAVGGTFFVQTRSLDARVLAAAMPVGALGVGLLAVNNLRDRPTDAKAGKRTLVVRWGEAFGRAEYALAIAVAFSVPVVGALAGTWPMAALWVLAATPLAARPLACVLTSRGATLNRALADTAALQLCFGVLFSLGLWAGGAT